MAITIYLQFSGYTGLAYDEHSQLITVPPAGFAPEDQAEIVARVAALFAPFACTVTDKPPFDLSARKCIVCVIGGDEMWSGVPSAQAGRIGGWCDPGWNRCYVPHLPTFSRYPPGVAATIAHEIGHVCGLCHYMRPGSTTEYLRDLPDGNCPIMGSPSDATRAVWSSGKNDLGQWQDDKAVLNGVLGIKEKPIVFDDCNLDIQWPRAMDFKWPIVLRNSSGARVRGAKDSLSATATMRTGSEPGIAGSYGTLHDWPCTFEELGYNNGPAGVYHVAFKADLFGPAEKLLLLIESTIPGVPDVELRITPVD